ncbi:hypothetical protein FIB82_15925 [Escherichia coli]|uniref:hypothetical protein n=1 Tax=Escherichia coli TaxID=562 RepID=UPI00111E43A5|nr:hypothetical protein [Escherichia coli]TNT97081.1 hypothetical protein FIB82_15925 [Escherichia coli]
MKFRECGIKIYKFPVVGQGGQGGQEIQASPGRQELKIKMSNGSSANIRIMPLPNGKIVELPIDVTLDTTKGKCGDTEGNAILQYTLN